MAIANYPIKVQGLGELESKFEGVIQKEIAALNRRNFLISLLLKDPLANMPFLNYASSLGGTEFYSVFKRTTALPNGVRNKEDIYDATKYSTDAQFRTNAIKIDNRTEMTLTLDYWDRRFGNPQLVAEAFAKWTRIGLNAVLSNFKLQILELVTGHIKKSPTNDENYDNTITAVLNTKLGKPNRSEADIRNDFDLIYRTVDKLRRTPNEEDFFPRKEDYVILVSPTALLNLSKAYERYTSETVRAFKLARPVDMLIAGLRIYEEPFLDTYVPFSGDAKIHKTKTYDFRNIDCVIIHKRAVFPKVWTFGELFTWQTAGQIFATLKAGWGLYDGLIRPKQVAYLTQQATKTTSRTV